MFDTQDRITQIRARLAAATPGANVPHNGTFNELMWLSWVDTPPADVQFVAFAPSDIAFLLNEVGRLEGLLSDAGDKEVSLRQLVAQMQGAIAEYWAAEEGWDLCPNIAWQLEQARERLDAAQHETIRLRDMEVN